MNMPEAISGADSHVIIKAMSEASHMQNNSSKQSNAPLANYAFIDGQNLYSGVLALGWKLDFTQFRQYLRDTYNISKAFLFIGYMEEQQELYDQLEYQGYTLVFKPTITYKDGLTKGNVDADLVLNAMIEYADYKKAVIVTGDGDFYCLIDYLRQQNKLAQVLIPNERLYSTLFEQIDAGSRKYFTFINRLRKDLEYKPRSRNRNKKTSNTHKSR
ncbi:hypothetical protein BRC19_00540 [Candidatus Saccharibacteria bacterium QS_5_54_17]|nr:MAG: hypothetical protein BRC19_00540 [Candidatus Saccharibacteria bacterium QS_5_54_17]PSO43788.1 MAG: hypothetical protein BRC20_00020 [Candidatus Saccharibacteria bacterium QS_8_54_8]